MLDTIGAGATATTSTDWHDIWMKSPEAAELQEQIEEKHSDGRSRPRVTTERHSEFATSWIHQAVALTKRNFQAYWRNPTYLIAKMVLNIVGGLLVGFTFFHTSNTVQGTQNKLFVRFFVARPQIKRSFQFRQYSWRRFSVFPYHSNCNPSTSTFALSTKSASVQAECTAGPHSLHHRSWSRFLGTSFARRSSSSVGTGQSVTPRTERATRISCMESCSLCITPPLHRLLLLWHLAQ
jgi:ATP-binding cassette subfamily G (WHITE) protein 2 (SNQ2)